MRRNCGFALLAEMLKSYFSEGTFGSVFTVSISINIKS